jgi:uncharacterized protein with PIN domain
MTSNSSHPYVLDAFAVIAIAFEEPGAGRVEELLNGPSDVWMSVVNVAEALYRIERENGEKAARDVLAILTREISVHLVEADLQLSIEAARFKAVNPISLADCYAAALTE